MVIQGICIMVIQGAGLLCIMVIHVKQTGKPTNPHES